MGDGRFDAEARTAAVLGDGPRLEPLPEAALGARERAVIQRMRELIGANPDKPVAPIFRTLCRHPDFFLDFLGPGLTIMAHSAFAPRERELVILRTGWLCGAPFEFGEHVHRGRAAGLNEAEIARVTEGSGAAGWSSLDAALLRAVEELHADSMIADATWAALRPHLDDRQLIELPMIVGHYHKAAFVQNSLKFAFHGRSDGFALRQAADQSR